MQNSSDGVNAVRFFGGVRNWDNSKFFPNPDNHTI